MFHPTPGAPSFWAYRTASLAGCQHVWEFHLTRECPAWSVDPERLKRADSFPGNLGQAMDQYCALVAENGFQRAHFVVCRCVVMPILEGDIPDLHGTITIHLNP